MRPFSSFLLTAFTVAVSAATVHAATLSYSPATPAPVPGALDISNFTGATNGGNNVQGGSTYVAHDQGALGQTFTTGTGAAGYQLNALTLQQVTYSNTYAGTDNEFGNNRNGTRLTLRVGTISNGTFTPIFTDTATATGNEANQPAQNPPGSSTTGNGAFVTLTLTTPLNLAAGTTYAFDVAVTGVPAGQNFYFETNGTSTDAYTAGQAFTEGQANGNASGGNNVVSFSTGDRVFDLGLIGVPEPSTWFGGLLLVAGVGWQFVRRGRSLATA